MNSKAKQRAAVTGRGRSAGAVTGPEPVGAADRDDDSPGLAGGSHVFAVAAEDRGKRLDRFLAERFTTPQAVSRTRLQGLIGDGLVRVDGHVAASPNFRLDNAGQVAVDIPPPVAAEPLGEHLPLTVVFEDDHLLVLDKQAGLVVHPASGHATGTLVNALIAHCGQSLSGIGGVKRPGIVHRLDKDTTGLMAVAKSDAAHQGLAALFADHGRSGFLQRAYTAFVWGTPPARSGTIDLPLGRHAHHRERMAVVPAGKGRTAVTHWTLRADHGVASAVTCRLETGRTHQIRVHLTEIGHPLIGDPVYGTGFKTKVARLPDASRAAVEGLGRQALHASVLGFEHPVTGQRLLFESALPADLRRLEEALSAI